MNKKNRIYFIIFSLLICLTFPGFLLGNMDGKIDLNQATLEEITQLPVSKNQAEALNNWLIYIGPFESVYDLLKVEGIDYQTFLEIKALVKISPELLAESDRRVEDNYYKIERWMSSEGASENFVSRWMDLLANPVNVNNLGFFELINFSGVSPIDALAVIKKIQSTPIKSRRDLRNTENLSHFGFTNLEDFIKYTDDEKEAGISGNFSSVYKNITLSQTPSDDASSFSKFIAHNYPLDAFNKFRLKIGNDIHFQVSQLRNLGENNIYYDNNGEKQQNLNIKAFVEINKKNLGPLKFNKIILGNYVASFGQGITMDATDFFLPRKSGFGWKKRVVGITGNISRTTQAGFQGAAFETQFGKFIGTGLFSLTNRDAIINSDSSFSSMITMFPRMNYGLDSLVDNNMINSLKEMMIGGNVKYSIFPGTYVGATIYQSMYNRKMDLQIKESILNSSGQGKYLTHIGNSADSEIAAAYRSSSSSIWSKAESYRRVYGLEFMSVINNVSFQGEYSQLDKDGEFFKRQDDPKALVLSGYMQFDNFNFLLLYRDYDLEYDNPYQRSFSNYSRFKGSVYEDIFYLKDPALAYLYSASAQPQAEKGIYYSSRYQIHRTLVANIEQDIWQRVADKAQYNRLVLRLEYRPLFKYRFRIRQKWQHRDKTNTLSPVSYQSNETRLEAIMRMSRFNQIRILYSLGFTEFTPRSRLIKNAETGEDSYVGNAGMPSQALGITITHNMNERIKFMGSMMTYKGFLWNFEDTDFRIFNTSSQAFHGWLTIFTRLSSDLSVRFKYTFDLHEPVTNVIGGYNNIGAGETNPFIDEIYYRKSYSDFRLQIDYRF